MDDAVAMTVPDRATLHRLAVPPAEFATADERLRSPLLRDDGRAVRTADEWAERRLEILAYWHAQLGPWPPLLDAPRFEILDAGVDLGGGLRRHRVRVAVTADKSLDCWFFVPDGAVRRPTVLTVYYEAESAAGLGKSQTICFARDLARLGFTTLSLGAQPYRFWSPEEAAFYPDDATGWQPLSYLAFVAANACTALAARPEVDPDRIGIAGHSYGGKWAMFASCLHERFAAAAWSDGGIVFDESRANVNYWEPWYLGNEPGPKRERGVIRPEAPRTGPYARLVGEGRDLHELHALMAPRPFLVSGGSEDPPERWRALAHSIAVNQVLGAEGRVFMSNRDTHAQTPESLAIMYAFFVHELAGGPLAG